MSNSKQVATLIDPKVNLLWLKTDIEEEDGHLKMIPKGLNENFSKDVLRKMMFVILQKWHEFSNLFPKIMFWEKKITWN